MQKPIHGPPKIHSSQTIFQQPIKRYCGNVKPRRSEQYISINLRSLPIVNDQTQSNTLS